MVLKLFLACPPSEAGKSSPPSPHNSYQSLTMIGLLFFPTYIIFIQLYFTPYFSPDHPRPLLLWFYYPHGARPPVWEPLVSCLSLEALTTSHRPVPYTIVTLVSWQKAKLAFISTLSLWKSHKSCSTDSSRIYLDQFQNKSLLMFGKKGCRGIYISITMPQTWTVSFKYKSNIHWKLSKANYSPLVMWGL